MELNYQFQIPNNEGKYNELTNLALYYILVGWDFPIFKNIIFFNCV